MPKLRAALFCLVGSLALAHAPDPQADIWAPVRFLVGEWEGTASGEPGTGKVVRRYEVILKERFLSERSQSTFAPTDKAKPGEVHEHLSLFSHDRKRNTLVFRQFHQEGFVVTYVLNRALGSSSRLVFESEQLENVPESWKARETYERQSDGEFTETFELSQGGKPYTVYSRNHFKRRAADPGR